MPTPVIKDVKDFSHVGDIAKSVAEQKLLEFDKRLTTDDAFRDEFAKDPKGTVAKYGYPIPSAILPDKIDKMPAKEDLIKWKKQAGVWAGGIAW